jgi:hypothetical protein
MALPPASVAAARPVPPPVPRAAAPAESVPGAPAARSHGRCDGASRRP